MTASKKMDCLLFGLGGLLFILGVGLAVGWPYIYNNILDSKLVLTNHSKSYEMWIKTPLPMYLDVYLFNWTNSAEFKKNPKIKPVLQEVGPFVFLEVHERVNVTWNADGSVSYNQTRNWTFIPELSVDLNSKITNLNVIALGAAHATRYSDSFMQKLFNPVLLAEGSLFVTKPASQWLFVGIDDPLLDLINKKWVKFFVHLPIPFDRFGFFYGRNLSATYDGHFKTLTGSNNLRELSMMQEWNSRNKTDFFPGACGVVSGSSGEIFPPIANGQKDFTLFITDVCSTLTLKYDQAKLVEGVRGRQFVGDETMFDNGQTVAEQACFCEGECQPPGVRNLTRCRQGAPVFVSFPHFYKADPSYTAAVDGLAPNKSLHEFRITLEPTTGIPLDVRAQIQVNLLLQPYSMYTLYSKMPRVYIPMLWFSQRAHITPPLVSQASLLLTINGIGSSLFYIIATIGFVMVILRFWLKKKTTVDEEREPIIPSGRDDES